VILGPGNEAVRLRLLGIFHARCRINLDELRFSRPFEYATHGVDEMPSLCRCCLAPITTVDNVRPGNLGGLLITGLLQNVTQNILTLPPGR